MTELAASTRAPAADLSAWLLAARPRTLAAALAPVAVGTGLAAQAHGVRALPALAALLGALFIQIGTNLANDYYDFKRGADTAERVGPTRVTQSGLIAPATVKRAAFLCFGLSMLTGLYLTWVAGWPIAVIGVLSVLSGYAYTGGPFPLGYNGLGDLFVLVFFGAVAVLGTAFVQLLRIPEPAFLAWVPVGFLATAILVVNNLRDRLTDAKAGKRTLAVRLGERATRAQYTLLLAGAYVVPPLMWWAHLASAWVMLPLVTLPLAIAPLRLVLTGSGAALNPGLGSTARLQLLFSLLLAAGLWLSHG